MTTTALNSSPYQLAGKHPHKCFGGSRVAPEFRQQGLLRIEAHAGVSHRDGFAMILRREERCLGDELARAGRVQGSLAAVRIDARKPDVAET
jgi:hypothetical protein